jgi:hypothetical protein
MIPRALDSHLPIAGKHISQQLHCGSEYSGWMSEKKASGFALSFLFIVVKLALVGGPLLYVVLATEDYGYDLLPRVLLAPVLLIAWVIFLICPVSWAAWIFTIGFDHPVAFTIALGLLALRLWKAIFEFLFDWPR